MASIDLNRLWVHDATDLADHILVRAHSIDEEPSTAGEVRSYGSRRRIVTTGEESRTAEYEAKFLPRTDLDWLLARRGRLLLWRDHSGRLLWGTVFAVPFSEWKHRSDVVRASWTVVEATHTVEV